MEIDIISWVAQNGYPAFVATFLLVKFQNSLDALTKAVNDLRSVIGGKNGNGTSSA